MESARRSPRSLDPATRWDSRQPGSPAAAPECALRLVPRATALMRPPPLGEKISASAERGRYVEVGHVDGDERNPDRVSVDEGVPQAPELEGR